jgi:hypothetical protein
LKKEGGEGAVLFRVKDHLNYGLQPFMLYCIIPARIKERPNPSFFMNGDLIGPNTY